MTLILGHRSNLEPAEIIFSDSIEIENTGIFGDLLEINIGRLYVNGVPSARSATVQAGDIIQIRLNSPNGFGQNATCIIRQAGNVVGYFIVITRNVFDFSYDQRYNRLFSFEVTEDVTWVLSPVQELRAYETDGTPASIFDLTQTPTGVIGNNSVVSLDYHRNKVVVFDTDSQTVSKVLADGQGPCAETTVYDEQGELKTGSVIAYNLSNEIVFYDSTFSVTGRIQFPNVGFVAYANGFLYAAEKFGFELRRYTLNTANMQVVGSPQVTTLLERVNFLLAEPQTSEASRVYVFAEDKIYDPDLNLLTSLPFQTRSAAIRVLDRSIYVTHSVNNFISIVNTEDNYSLQQLSIPGAVFLDTIAIQADGRIYVNDVENKVLYVRDGFNGDWELEFPGFGVALANKIYVQNIYENLPSKVVQEILQYEIDSSAFVDIEDVLIGSTETTGSINVIETNKPIPVTLFPQNEYATLLVNGEPASPSTTIRTDDQIAIRFDYDYGLNNPLVFGVIVDQRVFDAVVFADDLQIVPNEFIFDSVWGAQVDSLVTSNSILVSGLDRPVTISSPNSQILINDVVVDQPYVLNNGDSISLRVTAPSEGCATTVALLDLEQRFRVPFSVSTAGAEVPEYIQQFDFETLRDQPLGRNALSNTITIDSEEPVEYTIPDVYAAHFIHNGIPVGRRVTVAGGDTLALGLTTSYNWDTAHHVSVQSCYSVHQWLVYTEGDNVPDEFNFGTILDLSIKDHVYSDIVTVSGIGNSVAIALRFPNGVYPIINGVEPEIPSHLLDYRGVLLNPYTIPTRLSPGDTIQVRGYPQPAHGDVVDIPVRIGARRGYWTLGTYHVLEPIPTHLTESYDHEYFIEAASYDGAHAFVRNLDAIVSKSNKPVATELVRTATITSRELTTEHLASVTVQPVDLYADGHNAVFISNADQYTDVYSDVYLESNSYLITGLDVHVLSAGNHLVVEYDHDYIISGSNQHLFEPNKSWTLYNNNQDQSEYKPQAITNTQSFYEFELPERVVYPAFVFTHDPTYTQMREAVIYGFAFWTSQMVYQTDHEVFVFSRNPEFTRGSEWTNHSWQISEPYTNVVYAQTDRVEYDPAYVVVTDIQVTLEREFTLYTNVQVLHDTKYKVADGLSFAGYTPVYVYEKPSNTVEYDNAYHIEPEADSAIAYREEQLVFGSNQTFSERHGYTGDIPHGLYETDSTVAEHVRGSNQLLAEVIVFDYNDRNFVVEIAVDTEQQDYNVNDYTRTPECGTIHPGYFASHADAVANAYLWGVENGTFYTVYDPCKGWAWTEIVECENMCNPDDCPPHGYIYGG